MKEKEKVYNSFPSTTTFISFKTISFYSPLPQSQNVGFLPNFQQLHPSTNKFPNSHNAIHPF